MVFEIPDFDELPHYVAPIRGVHSKRIIAEHHYLGYAPCGYKASLGVYDKLNRLMGVMLFGHPVARFEDQIYTMELTRMFLYPSPKNSESRALSLAAKWIKQNHPEIRRLIAYADSERHEGTIYRAANWKYIGKNNSGSQSWGNRPNRRGRIGGDKHKFELLLKSKRGK